MFTHLVQSSTVVLKDHAIQHNTCLVLRMNLRAGIVLICLIAVLQRTYPSDLNVLLDFKSSLAKGSSNSSLLSTWDLSNPCTSWQGVECIVVSGETAVTNLMLFNMSIPGTVPVMLGQLKRLEYLDLSFNRFHGKLPEDIGNCTGLFYLDFSGNQLSGELPASIALLTRLKKLVLHRNMFEDVFPTAILELRNLSLLTLYENHFYGQLPEEIGKLQQLQYLYLSDNNFTGNIPQGIGNCKEMVYLTLYRNDFTGAIPASLSNLSNLKNLDIFFNRLQGSIPEGIARLSNLQEFFASHNLLNGSIPDLQNCTKLQELNLADNRLTGTIPSSTAGLKQLRKVWLYNNSLSGKIPDKLGEQSSLEIVYLSNNRLEGSIPSSLCQQKSLAKVYLQENNLSGTIPPELLSCPSLQRLFLHDNLLSGELPTAPLGSSLEQVDLSRNLLNGSIPSSIGNSSNLTALLLSENGFSGRLPQRLQHLQRFNVSRNMLSATIPPAFGPSLLEADLSRNFFVGGISREFQTSLIRLEVLRLQENRLSGELPAFLESSLTLHDLNLASNTFTGTIPSTFGSFQALQFLNLSHNQLGGNIPEQLGNMLGLAVVDLSYNNLTGSLPETWESRFNNSPAWFEGNPLSEANNLPSTKRKDKPPTASIVTGCLLGGAIVVAATYWSCSKLKRKQNQQVKSSRIMLEDILRGTNYFSSDLVVGEGSYGVVYKAVLGSGAVAAVKKLKSTDSVGSSLREWRTAGMVRHRNVVKLQALFRYQGADILVYDWMENGSLSNLLHRSPETRLPWRLRSKIALGTAQGLAYLHHDCKPAIVHRDIKSNNILLDGEMEAKIGDFGLAKLIERNAASNSASYIAGTLGYIAPEYAYSLRVDEMSDVYSFGVVLLELLVGRPPQDPTFMEESNMASWVREKCSNLDKVIDPKIWEHAASDDEERHEIGLVLKIALFCTNHLPGDRPSMRQVAEMLRQSCPQR